MAGTLKYFPERLNLDVRFLWKAPRASRAALCSDARERREAPMRAERSPGARTGTGARGASNRCIVIYDVSTREGHMPSVRKSGGSSGQKKQQLVVFVAGLNQSARLSTRF